MGEEVGAKEPFLYFTDHHDPALAEAVRNGRRQEFAKFPEFADEKKRAQIPDPNALETFERSRVEFPDNERRALYTRLLTLRRKRLVPRLKDAVSEDATAIGPKAVLARWRFADGGRLTIASNLGDEAVSAKLPQAAPIWGETPPKDELPAMTTLVWIENP
jgi:maltooligosyltrehalose trehalohydrolase